MYLVVLLLPLIRWFKNESNIYAQTCLSKYSTEFLVNFTYGELLINVAGPNFVTNNNIVVASQGAFMPPSGNPTPPFSPPCLPVSTFNSLSEMLGIYVTPYFFQTALWALATTGTFSVTISEADIPASSPVQFKTSGFFKEAVPGLSAYPNMYLQVTNTLTIGGDVTIDSTNGVEVSGVTFNQVWQIYNSTTTIPGWTLQALFEGDATVTAEVVSGEVLLFLQLMSDSANVTVVSSNVGTVSAPDFVQLFSLVSAILPKFNFTVPLPTEFTVGSVALQECDGFISLDAVFTYIVPSNDSFACGSYTCAAGNQCCGGSFCCADAGGTCCSTYCCPQGLLCGDSDCAFPSSSSTSTTSSSERFLQDPAVGGFKNDRKKRKKKFDSNKVEKLRLMANNDKTVKIARNSKPMKINLRK